MREFDYEKCIGCMKCVDDCINNYIVVKEFGDDKIRPAFKDRGICLNCRHCEAICPVGAVRNEPPEEKDELYNNALLDLMQKKRTHRHYVKEAEIPQDKMRLISAAAQSAPTDRNRKTVRVIYIKEILPEVYHSALDYLVNKVQENGKIDPLYEPTMKLNEKRNEILWNAEYLVVIAGGEQYVVDAAIMAERMQLMADDLALGTAYRGDMKLAMNQLPDIKKMLGLHSKESVLVAFALGIPQYHYVRKGEKQIKKISFL